MYDSELERTAHEVAAALDAQISALKARLSAAEQARDAIKDWLASSDEISVLPRPPMSADRFVFNAAGKRVAIVEEVPIVVLDPELDAKLEAALLAAGMSRRNSILEMLRVVASANNGLVPLRETAATLRKLNLSRSSASNLPGYVIKRLLGSGEFQREGQSGSGLYRRIRYVESAPAADSTGSF